MEAIDAVIVEGIFYTGDSSQSNPAVLRYNDATGKVTIVRRSLKEGAESVKGEPILISLLLADVEIPSRLADTRRRVGFMDGAAFVTQDNGTIDELAKIKLAAKRQSSNDTAKWFSGNWIHKLETNHGAVFASIIGIIAIAAITVVIGVPIAAKRIAYSLPQPIQHSMSVGTLELLDSLYLSTSELSAAEQVRIVELASDAIEGVGITSYSVQLRTGIGPNALALPDGTIIITDDIVELSANDDELLAVIYHEIGHLENRHLLRRVLQSSLVSLGLILISGNVESVDTLIALPTLYLDMSYTRDFEIEADRFALQSLKAQGLSADNFVSIMRKLEDFTNQAQKKREELLGERSAQERRQEKLLRYFSSHPLTEDRITLAAEYR